MQLRQSRRVEWGMLALAVLCAGAMVQAQEAAYRPDEIMPLEQVQAGMTGTAKTVFKGTKIEEFGIEVLGVLPKVDLGGDIILIRVTSGPVVERETNIIAGMSGSPVYIDGKVIGAIAYTWGLSKEPIGGVTPIESMLKVLAAAREQKLAGSTEVGSRRSPPPTSLAAPVRVGGRTFDQVLVSRVPLSPGYQPGSSTLALEPVKTPVLVSGFSDRQRERLAELLAAHNLELVQGPGAVGPREEAPVVPGAAVAVQLVRGDIDMSATGTLTYREGHDILAFGHPFMQRDEIDVSLATAYVIDVLPSLQRSFKFAASMAPVGRIKQDQFWAVAGTLGEAPETIPVDIEVRDLDRHRTRTVHVEVVKDRDLAPSLITAAAADAVFYTVGSMPDTMVSTVTAVTSAEGHTVQQENIFYGRGLLDLAAVNDLVTLMAALVGNPFHPTDLRAVRFTVELQRERRTAVIQNITVKDDVVKPGEDLVLTVELKPFEADPVTRTLTLHVPENVPPGKVRLGVAGGRYDNNLRKPLGLLQPVAQNFDQLLELLLDYKRNNELVAHLALPTQGVLINGKRLPALPSPVSQVLASARSSAVLGGHDDVSATLETEWDLAGQQFLQLTISEDGKSPSARNGSPRPSGAEETIWRGFDVGSGEEDRFPISYSPILLPQGEENPARTVADEKKKEAEKTGEVKGHVAPLWQEDSAEAFAQGEGENVAWSSAGEMRLTAASELLYESEAAVLWDLVRDEEGNLYLATGHDGQVLRRTPEGEVAVLFDADEPEILTLARDTAGCLYAGTAPGGVIYRITPAGEATVWADLPAEYVWDLVSSPDGGLFALTGLPAGLWRLTPEGASGQVAGFAEAHALALAVGEQGDCYVGTGDGGKVYRVRPDKRLETLFESDQTAITALAVTPEGALFAGSSPNGRVYRVETDGSARLFFQSPAKHIFALHAAPAGSLLALTSDPGSVFQIDVTTETAQQVFQAERAEILTGAWAEEGSFYLATSNPAEVFQLTLPHAREGEFLSRVFDAGGLAQWGRLTWEAETPAGTTLELQTRSGNTRRPDGTWSEWSSPYSQPDSLVRSSPARFLQYRLRLGTEAPAVTPVVRNVSIAYGRRAGKPTLTVSEPQGRPVWSAKKEIQWKAENGNGDTLAIDIAVSRDHGATWETVEKGLHRDPKYEWDTQKVQDGDYLLRVTASDRFHYPDDPRETEKITGPITIDNTEPKVTLVGEVVPENGRVTARAFARDETSPIAHAEYRLDDGDWLPALPRDGIFDDTAEALLIRIHEVKPGEHTLKVRAADKADNTSEDERKFSVENPPPKEEAEGKEGEGRGERGKEGDMEAEEGSPQGETGTGITEEGERE